ncbi:hypothetical protein ABEB36_002736 [Hypothenemus hampei]|uniref:Carboxylic ester hydrolase n=1 Tax=Hypothenemus hampei TaxID=57062 RepID=A0ABD1FAG4_HYPHA
MSPAAILLAAILPILGILGKTVPEEQVSLASSRPVVSTVNGVVVGTTGVTDGGTAYNAFRGIPYAQPPIGTRRFAAPEAASNWSGQRDASQDASPCIQGSGNDIIGSEDCLYINVYAPRNAHNLAVMVWIHGGGFTGGDSRYDSYNPDFLLDENVVFVSLNYRLGIFGFMSTEDQTVSGNWGLKDQVLALQWVRENIEYFGGNSSRITIFGESAGGASVSYLLQIPQAQGLFDAAIIQSGNSLNLWSLTTRARQAAFQVGYNLGILALLSRTLLDRLRGIEAYRLQATAASVSTQTLLLNPLRGLIWAPCVEAAGPNAYFTLSSDDALRRGQIPNRVPILIGHTSNEAGHAHSLPETLQVYFRVFDIASNNLSPFSLTSASSTRSVTANAVRDFFFDDGSLSNQINEVVKFINADQFTRGALRFTENVRPFLPSVYFYIFGYQGQIVGETAYDGVGHAEELFYLFKQQGTYSQSDLIVRDKIVRLWTNFAKTFNPTPQREALLDSLSWPRVTSGNLDYVWINATLSRDINPDQDTYTFYQNLFNQYGDGSYTTY